MPLYQQWCSTKLLNIDQMVQTICLLLIWPAAGKRSETIKIRGNWNRRDLMLSSVIEKPLAAVQHSESSIWGYYYTMHTAIGRVLQGCRVWDGGGSGPLIAGRLCQNTLLCSDVAAAARTPCSSVQQVLCCSMNSPNRLHLLLLHPPTSPTLWHRTGYGFLMGCTHTTANLCFWLRRCWRKMVEWISAAKLSSSSPRRREKPWEVWNSFGQSSTPLSEGERCTENWRRQGERRRVKKGRRSSSRAKGGG